MKEFTTKMYFEKYNLMIEVVASRALTRQEMNQAIYFSNIELSKKNKNKTITIISAI